MSAAIRCALGGIAVLALSGALPAQAQNYPDKPVKLVVGFAAGGPTDIVARAFAESAARGLGQPVIVDNKPGANTIIAAEAVASAPADGHTLLLGATNHSMIPALYRNRVKFDAVKSFKPVCALAVSPTVLVVGPSMPVKSLAEWLQQVRAQPKHYTYATPGIGSSGHFAAELFAKQARVALTHVPYKGAVQAIGDTMGGQVDMSFATLGSVLPQIKAGKLTALAVAARQRSSQLPGVPTFEEQGIKGYSADAWYGLLAPAATPPAVVKLLERQAAAYAAAPGTAEKLGGLGMEPQTQCGDAFAKQIEREVEVYSQLARDLDLKAE
jgi:tripartite-type tricarboxylate transporter receptor subunit TctC